MNWEIGTAMLVGLVIGAGFGFLVDQVPFLTVLGLAIGCGWDSWKNQEQNQ